MRLLKSEFHQYIKFQGSTPSFTSLSALQVIPFTHLNRRTDDWEFDRNAMINLLRVADIFDSPSAKTCAIRNLKYVWLSDVDRLALAGQYDIYEWIPECVSKIVFSKYGLTGIPSSDLSMCPSSWDALNFSL